VGDSNPRAASLPRPTDSKMGGVYGTLRRAGGPRKGGSPRALGCLAASASIYLATEEGHLHGHASVTPEEVALGIGEQVSGVGTAYTTSGFVAPKGDSEAAIKDLMVGAG
jgi:hypothetical protein